MRRIDSYIKKALTFLNAQPKNAHGGFPKQYKGYVASFGTSVIHCGLVPSVIMFSNKNTASDGDKSFILDGIATILDFKDTPAFRSHVLTTGETSALRAKVCDAAVALKLALRTFKLD